MRARATLAAAGLAGLAIFAGAFYPRPPLTPGFAADAARPACQRLVFVLVDALRSDFAFGSDSRMSFVQSLIADGRALPFTAIAQAPTVTLPRLKALTTGSNPTFLDAILNISEDSASALEHVDSWVRQLVLGATDRTRTGKKVVFAGDDTWLRLFPSDWFTWSEGVSSFFVTDTHQVDRNVTRHLDSLLNETLPSPGGPSADWDVAILHYLGLDHIGHLAGPSSPLMQPKQQEMDDVVRRIFASLEKRDRMDGGRSVLVLVGDHGMSEIGNHGGSSDGETSAALLFASPSTSFAKSTVREERSNPYHLYDVVNQVDLVPTLSILLGLSISQNSRGVLITSVVDAFLPDSTPAIQANVRQIRALDCAAGRDREDCSADLLNASKEEMVDYLLHAQERLLEATIGYNLLAMAMGILLLAIPAIGFLLLSRPLLPSSGVMLAPAAIGTTMLVYLGSFFASSFIEEEHETWYFVTATAFLLLAARPRLVLRDRAIHVAVASSIRLLRAWSINGQKGIPTESLSMFLARSPLAVHSLYVSTILVSLLCTLRGLILAAQRSRGGADQIARLLRLALALSLILTTFLLQSLVLAATYAGRAGVGSSVAETLLKTLQELGLEGDVALSRAGFCFSVATWTLARGTELIDGVELGTVKMSSLALFLLSLSRPLHAALLIVMLAQYHLLAALHAPLSPLSFSFLLVCLQHSTYFAFGGSNSLATIDLSQAYNGLITYNLALVTILTFCSNFAGPMFWSVAAPTLLRTPTSTSKTTWQSHWLLTSTFHAWTILALALSATHFRHHLFVWTVHSPALLHKGVWSTFVHLGMDTLLGSIF